MSQATKRKHVVKEVLGEHMVPSDQQQIVRVSSIGHKLLCLSPVHSRWAPRVGGGYSAAQWVLELADEAHWFLVSPCTRYSGPQGTIYMKWRQPKGSASW